MATIAERIVEEIRFKPLDDDVLGRRLGIARQSANQTARRLEAQGVLVRHEGVDGKIVNTLNGDTLSPPAAPVAAEPGGRITEDEVKTAVQVLLEADGYTVTVAWGRTPGIDIEANKPGSHLVIEAKGEAPAGAQQHNYFVNALGELVKALTDPEAVCGLALPDHRQYVALVDRLPALARERLRLRVWFVGRESDGLHVREA